MNNSEENRYVDSLDSVNQNRDCLGVFLRSNLETVVTNRPKIKVSHVDLKRMYEQQ